MDNNQDCLSVNNKKGRQTAFYKSKALIDKQNDESDESNLNSFDSESLEWRLGDFLYKGSIGEVYRALDWNTAKLIAIKFLDWTTIDKLQTAELVYKLKEKINKIKEERDKNVIRYLTISEEEGEDGENMIKILMEYVPGDSIEYILKHFKSFKEPLAKIYISQVAQAISRLHSREIIHGDIKLSSLLVDDIGHVKVSDFGFIKSIYFEYVQSESIVDANLSINAKVFEEDKNQAIPDTNILKK